MKKEVIVWVQHRFQQKEGTWSNMGRFLKGYNRNTFPTREKAITGLNAYLKEWNGKKEYDANGERRETFAIGGGFASDFVSNKGVDYDLMVVAAKIKERDVSPWTEWEEVDISKEA